MRSQAVTMAALLVATAACGAKPEEPPVLVEAGQIEPLLEFSRQFNGHRVSVDGYVHIDDGPGGAAMVYTLMSRPRGLGDALVRFEAERGTGPNRLDLPVKSERRPEWAGGHEVLLVDLTNARFIDGAGEAHSIRDKVRVTGELASLPANKDPGSPTGWRHRPRLIDATFEAAP
ncbi:MAG: hypothetical protein ACK4JY_12440 [Brevundimonas sp.]|uniref:hypothetical protein n=1 Tax=Brevundimonas sp. TaxID=1871086 RepID=UPI00391B38C2